MSHVTNTGARYPHPDFSAVVVQAAMATSTRGRGEENSFNVLTLDTGEIRVRRYAWSASSKRFVASEDQSFRRESERWVRVNQASRDKAGTIRQAVGRRTVMYHSYFT